MTSPHALADARSQRAAVSFLVGLLSADAAPLLAVVAGTYVLWAPVALAARRAAPLRRLPAAGLWHATVLRCARAPGMASFDSVGDPFMRARAAAPATRLLLGDATGARLQLVVPAASRHAALRPGDAAELVVLSDDPGLRRFRVVRDAYVPAHDLWLADYPWLERTAFKDLSLTIAMDRDQGG